MNILLLCPQYGNQNNANGLCARNLSKELQKEHNVFCISNDYSSGEGDKTKFYSVDEPYFDKLTQKKNKNLFYKLWFYIYAAFRYPIVFFTYPNVSPIVNIKKYRLAKKIIKKENIDMVVGFYRPFEGVDVVRKLSKKMPHVKTVAYYLDNLLDGNNGKTVKNIKYRRGINYLNKSIKTIDKIILPPSEKPISDNSFISEFPMFIDYPIVSNGFKFEDNFINITYIGSLDENNRNPTKVLELLSRCKADKPLKVHIWGNVTAKIEKIISEYKNLVEYHGYVNNENVQYIYSISDFLLNISNKVTYKMMPSKIFQMFSTGKHILNYCEVEYDVTKSYFCGYPGTIELNNDTIVEELSNIITKFLGKGVRVNKDLYLKCTPNFIVNNILLNGFE